ncbi:MAG TPA: hypothetical protein VLW45_00695 [Pelomicrobium sp.]|nr:hypothetical protein [Pelomicrobium sp.]
MDVARHLVTVTIAAIGFLVTLMFTTFRGSPFMLSAQVALFSLLLCTIFAILAQMAVVEVALGGRPFRGFGAKSMLILAWCALVIGVTAFVVFTWANIHAG